MLVEDESSRLGVTDGNDAEEVPDLALEATGRERDPRQGRHRRLGGIDDEVQLDPGVGRTAREEVDDAQPPSVVVPGDEGEPHPLLQEDGSGVHQVCRLDDAGTAMPADRLEAHGRSSGTGHSATVRAAASRRPDRGQANTPMKPQTARPPIIGAATQCGGPTSASGASGGPRSM